MIINKSNDNGSGPWGSGGDQNPWGKRPNSNGTPPDVDELLRQSKDKLKKMMPGGFGGGFRGNNTGDGGKGSTLSGSGGRSGIVIINW